MAIFDIKLPKSIARALNIPVSNPRSQQIKVLKKLLKKARFTEFGQRYRFDDVLMSNHPGKKFQQNVPTFDYNKIYDAWWYKAKEGSPDVCWPGVIKYFALSSGTSDATSKPFMIAPANAFINIKPKPIVIIPIPKKANDFA